MGKHSVLKSVAHNWADSFLSDWNFVGDTIMIQHLLEAARAHGEPTLLLDPLLAKVKPETCGTIPVMQGLVQEATRFEDILIKQGCSMNMVSKVELEITFDLAPPCPSYADVHPGVYYAPEFRMPEAPNYLVRVRLIDDRGREHQAFVREFWRN